MNKQAMDKLQNNSLYWLVGGLILSALPHGLRIPLWIMPLLLVLCTWKLYLFYKRPYKEKKLSVINILVFMILIISIVGIFHQFGTLFGRSAGVSLLVLMTGFKIFEIKHERDFYVSCFLGYFLVVTNFLYIQTIGTAFYMAFIVLVMTLSLVLFNDTEGKLSARTSGKIAAALLLQSIPIMLILFFLFPRIPGPLWGMPNDAHSSTTGVNDEMSPGSISQLILSNKVAFRADFKNARPEKSQLYWRGPVLLHTNGTTWRRGKHEQQPVASLETMSDPFTYTITLEAHNKKWLYALDMPDQEPALENMQSWMTSDFQLLTNNPVIQRIRYDMISYPEYKTTKLHDDELKIALQLPINQHSKTKELVRQWRNTGLSSDQIIERALKLFNEDEFYYTLTPPLLKNDRVDEFLFETKQGFCEHYANAFAVMMRAAGIPTRVVLGYQGGNYNPVGDYVVVHQRNAHAWTEVWKQDQGWIRIDPTSAVSPLRIIEGIESALPDNFFDVPSAFSQNSLVKNLWQGLGYRWDAINNQWNQWVINYGPNRQREFLGLFGLQDINWSSMIFLIMAFGGVILLYLTFMVLKITPQERDPVRHLYNKFCKKLSHCGIYRDVYEGPIDFARRASTERSDLASQIKNITDIYITIRYGSNKSQIPAMQAQVRSFRPSTKSTWIALNAKL